MGTSAFMMTEVLLRERLGEPLPEGVAIGPDGEPTRDAALARRGALLPFGGYKGFGLALMMQAMGLLAGLGPNGERDYGYLFIAFKPDLLGPADAFEREVAALIDRVKASPSSPASTRSASPPSAPSAPASACCARASRSTAWCSTRSPPCGPARHSDPSSGTLSSRALCPG